MKKLLKYIILFFIIVGVILFFINMYVYFSIKNNVINNFDDIDNKFDCVLVLGAGVWGDNPSPMLQDRLDVAIDLYNKKIVSKIIMSGDHSKVNYDEVNVMKDYAIKAGVPSSDIFMDHAGFSTYDSIYRAKNIFKVNKMIIVTQKYHLFRSLYIANKLDIKAYGVKADKRRYAGFIYREAREVLARDKDFFKCIVKPTSKYLGDEIPVNGDGDITNDK